MIVTWLLSYSVCCNGNLVFGKISVLKEKTHKGMILLSVASGCFLVVFTGIMT